jgi:hypothetical protein
MLPLFIEAHIFFACRFDASVMLHPGDSGAVHRRAATSVDQSLDILIAPPFFQQSLHNPLFIGRKPTFSFANRHDLPRLIRCTIE